MATIGWYGPLIDLSKAVSHIGDFVQLVVLVHKSTPIQYKLSKGGEAIRTDIQVGDDTRSFFSVSIWKKGMGSFIVAGDVILLESVDKLIENCRVGVATKEKLVKVIKWVQRAGPTPHNFELHCYQGKRQSSINWKVHEETQDQDCFSLSEVLRLTDSCKATFLASVGEIFLPITWRCLHESEEEMMFIRRRLCITGDRNLVEDLVCTGCQLCGTPMNSEIGSKLEQDAVPLHCQKSSNRLHVVSLIYRPFMLYVWDDSNYIPLAVTNKAAELLFGNIKADSVHSCYRKQSCGQIPDKNITQKEKNCCRASVRVTDLPSDMEGRIDPFPSTAKDDSHLDRTEKHQLSHNLDFYSIWLILLQTMLQPGKNSPLKFNVRVNVSKECESGRFEMLSMSLHVL